MAYIGNIPAESYASFERQVFTIVNSQTAYTLTHAVTNENDIRLVVNNVVQEPGSGKAYTASNTTLTLSAALVNGTDEMYCVYLGRALQTVNPPNASVGSAQIADDLISGKTALGATPADTDELLISDAGTLKRVDFSHLKSANTPAFGAYAGSDQSGIADDTWTKVAMNTEFYDTDSKYDTSTYRFTPGTAGKYMFGASIFLEQSNTNEACAMSFYKNGAKNIYTEQLLDNTNRLHLTGVMDLDADDYVELYAVVNMNSGNTWTINQDGAVTNRVFWYGYKLIGA